VSKIAAYQQVIIVSHVSGTQSMWHASKGLTNITFSMALQFVSLCTPFNRSQGHHAYCCFAQIRN